MLPPTGPPRTRRRPGGRRAVLVGLVAVASAVLAAAIVDRSRPEVFVPAPSGPPSATARTSGTAFDPARVSVTLAPFVDGLAAPLAIVNAGDGTNRLFVAGQAGQIPVIRDGRLVAAPFLRIPVHITTA